MFVNLRYICIQMHVVELFMFQFYLMIAVLYLNSQCEHYALLVICDKYQFAYLLCYPFCPFFTYITRPRAIVYRYLNT
jgi:hypothetical protein